MRTIEAMRPALESPTRRRAAGAKGFSLIELIVVMAVVGILTSIIALFIRHPIEGYVAASRRAALVDAANTALQRLAREVQQALPNSLRLTQVGGVTYLEYLPVVSGGRYRAELAGDGSGDILDFASGSDAGFDVLGPAVTAGAYLVVYNLGLDASSDAWLGGNRRDVTSVGSVNHLAFTATGTPLPLESPSRRFFLAGQPVTLVCDPTAGELRRIDGYALQATQPTSFGGAASRLLANHVGTCTMNYDASTGQRLGQLTLRLQLTQDGETVTLYREVVVNNEA